MEPRAVACLVLLTSLGCKGVERPPAVDVNQVFSTHYIQRGLPHNERGVYQVDGTITLGFRDDSTFSGTVWANIDLSEETGASFPDGNQGQFTEIDVSLDHTRQLGPWSWSLGYTSYNFPNVFLRSTSEVFSALAREDLWLQPSVAVYLDIEEAKGVYASAAVAHSWALGAEFALDGALELGYTDDDQSLYYYGLEESGLADLVATVTLSYFWNAHTSLTLAFSGTTVVDDDLSDSLEDSGLDPDNLSVALGVGWSH